MLYLLLIEANSSGIHLLAGWHQSKSGSGHALITTDVKAFTNLNWFQVPMGGVYERPETF